MPLLTYAQYSSLASSGSQDDTLFQFLRANYSGTMDDMFKAFLASKGLTGSISDMYNSWDGTFGGATSSSLIAFDRKVGDRAWTWHNNDILLWDSTSSRSYKTSIDVSTGDQVIDVHNSAGVKTSTITITDGVFPVDDHNAPAQVMFDSKYFIGYAGHNDDNFVYLRESTDNTPENLGSVVSLDTGFPVTYAQFAEVDDTLYLTCRTGNSREQWFLYERTGVDTWTKLNNAATSTTQTYINLRSSGSKLRMVAWDHPTTSSEPYRGEIYTREFDPDDTVVNSHSLGEVYDPGTGKSTRVLSVTRNGKAILFAEFTLADLSSQTYHVLRYSGSGSYDSSSNWTKEDVGTTAYNIYSASNYVSGAEFADLDGDAIWVCEATSGGVTTLKYGVREDSVWSFSTKVNSDVPLVRPIADPNLPGQVHLMRVNSYVSFSNLDTDSYIFYTGDSLTEDSFANPAATALRTTPEVVEYFDSPDTSDVSWTVDLTEAVDGDTIIFSGLLRNNQTVNATLGGVSMTRDRMDNSFPVSHFTFSITYTDGMGDTLFLDASGVPSYQKGVLSIINKEVTYQDGGETPSFLSGDFVTGSGHSSGDASATHTYTPDLSLGEVLHGSNTVVSLCSGVATSGSTGSIILAGSGLSNESKDLAVYR